MLFFFHGTMYNNRKEEKRRETMEGEYTLRPVARIRSDFTQKFGIPRQSGMVPGLEAAIVFEPPYRNREALRGLEEYSHLWLIWQFSQVVAQGQDGDHWRALVRPPRLGGNTRMGVWATRSPYRPNALGLSSVRLVRIQWESHQGPILWVEGADLLDGTPIYDIKPYLPYVDSHPEAREGFTRETKEYTLEVNCPEELLERMPPEKRTPLLGVLAGDPRPGYQDDPERVYGMAFGGYEVRFQIRDKVLTVVDIHPEGNGCSHK